MTRVRLDDLPSYQLKLGDRVISQRYDARKNTVMFSILRKVEKLPKVQKPEGRWEVYSRDSAPFGTRVRFTAPDDSGAIELKILEWASEAPATKMRLMIGTHHIASYRRQGWTVERWIEP